MKTTELTWIRVEAGEYRTADGRFIVRRMWLRLGGEQWRFFDLHSVGRQPHGYPIGTLAEGKRRATRIVTQEV